MEQTIKQKFGIFFLIIGAFIIFGFYWAGPLVIIIGLLLVILGIFLAISDDSKLKDNQQVSSGTDYEADD